MNGWPGSFAVGCGLLAWGAIAIALVRAAERRACPVARPQPQPWGSAAAVLAVTALAMWTRPLPAAAACGAACIALVAAAAGDRRTGYLFDDVTLPAAVLVTALALWAGGLAEATSGVLLLVGGFGALVVCSRGRWMGLGDVKAMYALGAAFGPVESLVAILIACLGGIAGALLAGRASGGEVRFGPYLAAGAALTLAAGDGLGRHLWGG